MRPGMYKLSLFILFLCVSSCSVPNLETPECGEARYALKRFYSFHFANELQPTDEALATRDSYLTEGLIKQLPVSPGRDYFTQTDDFPKAFRIGNCTAESERETVFQVVLLWRDDTRNEQSEVKVRTVKAEDKWLIESVSE